MQRAAMHSLLSHKYQWSLDLNSSKCKGLPSNWVKEYPFSRVFYTRIFFKEYFCVLYIGLNLSMLSSALDVHYIIPLYHYVLEQWMCKSTLGVTHLVKGSFLTAVNNRGRSNFFFQYSPFNILDHFSIFTYDKLICKRTVPNIPCLANNEILEVKRNILLCKNKSCVGCFQGEHFPVCA